EARRRGPRARLGARGIGGGVRAAPELPDAQASGLREEVALAPVERLEVRVRRRSVLVLGDDGVDHRRGEVAPDPRVLTGEAQLEPALDEQLLVDQAIEDEATVRRLCAAAPVALEGVERARVVVGAEERAVHARDRAGRKPASARDARGDEARRGERDAGPRTDREQ